jgi:uncharacterized protein YprB with RNaseH-like and TPR domain
VADKQVYTTRRSRMHIIARFEVTDTHRQLIARALGQPGLADREMVRAYLQQHGDDALQRLSHPLINHEAH